MKKNIQVIVMALCLITSISSQATEKVTNPEPSKSADSFVLKETGDTVLFNLLNLDLNAIKIMVKDDLGRIIYTETIANTKSIHKVYNFEKAYAGTYFITVKDGKKNYSKKIVVS